MSEARSDRGGGGDVGAAPLGLLLDGPASEAEAWLAARGMEEPAAARRALQLLFREVSDPAFALRFLDALLERLPDSPDPDRALNHLCRWVAQLSSVRDALATLLDDARLFDDLLLLFGASNYLADILVREPTLYALLLEQRHGEGEGEEDAATLKARLSAAVAPFSRPSSRLDALRRFKRREFLRIAWRDLTGRDDFPTVVRAISDLADALIAQALELCREELVASSASLLASSSRPDASPVPFAVIAMGKLGARELNYSSDVDLLFLCDVPEGDERGMRQATRLAETLVAALSRPTAEGHLFRVDMRLRPEGRSGALVRSLASYREYYDRWMETWERQALIKARFIAGSADLGRRFEQMIAPRVWRRLHSTAILEDVRDVKRAIERRVEQAGQETTNVKEGRGTIRDIEFAVQLLQLLFGGERADLRVRDTLTAIARLTAAGLLSPEEARTLREQYGFFRRVEHCLQLMDDLPTRLLPETPCALRRLARQMGYRTEEGAQMPSSPLPAPPESSEADRFRTEYLARAAAVQRVTGALIARLAGDSAAAGDAEAMPDLRDLVLAVGEAHATGTMPGSAFGERERSDKELEAKLALLGFLEPKVAAESVTRLVSGGPHVRLSTAAQRTFADLAVTLLPRAAQSPDPEGALRVIEALVRRMGTYQTFYRTLLEQPDMCAALCVVAGTSPWVAEEVTRRPELLDAITDPEFLRQPRPPELLLAEARRRRDAMRSVSDRRNALRRFKKRETLRIAARDLLLNVPPVETTAELAHVADASVQAGLELAWETALGRVGEPIRGFSIIALGRHGGEELHYSSDLDLLYLYDPRRAPEGAALSHADYETLAAVFAATMQDLTEEGRLYEIDLRLRPEGKSALILVHLDAARQYYGPGGRSQTWEKQSLIKARGVAGDLELAAEFLALVAPEVYPLDPPAERDAEVRAMKRRVETERVRETERTRHVKLGPGGLSDVEFLVQLLQLRHGGRVPSLRVRNTTAALAALGNAGILPPADAATLADHYAFLTRLRQRLWLRSSGVATDLVPTEPGEALRLARALGLPYAAALHAEYARRTAQVRALFERWFA